MHLGVRSCCRSGRGGGQAYQTWHVVTNREKASLTRCSEQGTISPLQLSFTLSLQLSFLMEERTCSKCWTGGQPATDPVEPSWVPYRRLGTATRMPAIGLGTFGSGHVSHAVVAEAVKSAAAVGYRHFDCASVYGSEDRIGQSFEEILSNGVKREELWVTSKLWNDKHGLEDVVASCEQSLADLRLDYLDLYLIHWPFPNHHPPHCDVTVRNPNAMLYIHERYMRTWRKMEELVDRGLVLHIGTSNMTIPKMELLLRDARIWPVVNEMELHPHFQRPEFFAYLVL